MSSGGSNAAQQQANANEAARQQQIATTTGRINDIFNSPSRQQQYTQLGNSLMNQYTADANRQKTVADRNLQFSLARSGLTGGSAAADAGNLEADEYNRGMLAASQKAQGAVASLRGQDATTRAQLTQLAQNGLDSTSAAQQAQEGMAANVGNAQANATAQGLGDLFTQTKDVYSAQQQAAATRKQLSTPVGSIYGMGSGSIFGG